MRAVPLNAASASRTASEPTKAIGTRLRALTIRPCLLMTAGFQSPYS